MRTWSKDGPGAVRRRVVGAPLVAATLAAVGLGACGAPPAQSSSATVPTTAGPSASSPTTAAGAGAGAHAHASATVTVPKAGTYVLSVAETTGAAPCATPGGGRHVPIAVSIRNPGSSAEPLARVGLQITDPAQGSGHTEVAAISYQGVCLNFTEPGGTLGAGQTVTYRGTASNVTATSKLTVNVLSTPDNRTLGSVAISL